MMKEVDLSVKEEIPEGKTPAEVREAIENSRHYKYFCACFFVTGSQLNNDIKQGWGQEIIEVDQKIDDNDKLMQLVDSLKQVHNVTSLTIVTLTLID